MSHSETTQNDSSDLSSEREQQTDVENENAELTTQGYIDFLSSTDGYNENSTEISREQMRTDKSESCVPPNNVIQRKNSQNTSTDRLTMHKLLTKREHLVCTHYEEQSEDDSYRGETELEDVGTSASDIDESEEDSMEESSETFQCGQEHVAGLQQALDCLRVLCEEGAISQTVRTVNEQRVRRLMAALITSQQKCEQRQESAISDNQSVNSLTSVSQLDTLTIDSLRRLLNKYKMAAEDKLLHVRQLHCRIDRMTDERQHLITSMHENSESQQRDGTRWQLTPALLERQISDLRRQLKMQKQELIRHRRLLAQRSRHIHEHERVATSIVEQITQITQQRNQARQQASQQSRNADNAEKQLLAERHTDKQLFEQLHQLYAADAETRAAQRRVETNIERERRVGGQMGHERQQMMENCRRVAHNTDTCRQRAANLQEHNESLDDRQVQCRQETLHHRASQRDTHKTLERLERDLHTAQLQHQRRIDSSQHASAITQKYRQQLEQLDVTAMQQHREHMDVVRETVRAQAAHQLAATRRQQLLTAAESAARSQQLTMRDSAARQLRDTRLAHHAANRRRDDARKQIRQQEQRRGQIEEELRQRSAKIRHCEKQQHETAEKERQQQALVAIEQTERDAVTTQCAKLTTEGDELEYRADVQRAHGSTLEQRRKQLAAAEIILHKELIETRSQWHTQSRLVSEARGQRLQLLTERERRKWRYKLLYNRIEHLLTERQISMQQLQRFCRRRQRLAKQLLADKQLLAATHERISLQQLVLATGEKAVVNIDLQLGQLMITLSSHRRQLDQARQKDRAGRQLSQQLHNARNELAHTLKLGQSRWQQLQNPVSRRFRYTTAIMATGLGVTTRTNRSADVSDYGDNSQMTSEQLHHLQQHLLSVETRAAQLQQKQRFVSQLLTASQQQLKETTRNCDNNGTQLANKSDAVTIVATRLQSRRTENKLKAVTAELAAAKNKLLQEQQLNEQLKQQLSKTITETSNRIPKTEALVK